MWDCVFFNLIVCVRRLAVGCSFCEHTCGVNLFSLWIFVYNKPKVNIINSKHSLWTRWIGVNCNNSIKQLFFTLMKSTFFGSCLIVQEFRHRFDWAGLLASLKYSSEILCIWIYNYNLLLPCTAHSDKWERKTTNCITLLNSIKSLS